MTGINNPSPSAHPLSSPQSPTPQNLSLPFPQHKPIILKTIPPAQNLHLSIPLATPVKNRPDEMRLPVRNVQKEPISLQHALHLCPRQLSPFPKNLPLPPTAPKTYLTHIRLTILQHLVGRAPRTPEDHGIEGALVEGDIDAGGAHMAHIADIADGDLDARLGGAAVPRLHQVDDDGGEVDAKLVVVALREQVIRDCLCGRRQLCVPENEEGWNGERRRTETKHKPKQPRKSKKEKEKGDPLHYHHCPNAESEACSRPA